MLKHKKGTIFATKDGQYNAIFIYLGTNKYSLYLFYCKYEDNSTHWLDILRCHTQETFYDSELNSKVKL